MNLKARPWYFWPLIAFVVGLLIGWLVIGWALWPVTWTNALVQDLRPDLRNQYLTMVAESFAQNRNLEVARGRLSGWSVDDVQPLLEDLSTVLAARDMQAARHVQELTVALGTGQAGAPAAQPRGAGEPTVQPTATSVPPADTNPPLTFGRVCTAALFILLALGALVALVYLLRRWRQAHSSVPGLRDEAGSESSFLETHTSDLAEQEKGRWPPVRDPLADFDRQPGVAPSAPASRPSQRASDDYSVPRAGTPDERGVAAGRPVGPIARPSTSPEPPEPRSVSKPAPVPAAPRSGDLQRLDENTAVYQMGEPDYDEAFDINDPVDGYMGQYGLQLIEPYGRNRDQAVALQVWLWDSSDPDTQTMVLMSEGAYRDTSIRSQHVGEHEIIGVRPGTEFELSSHDLLLRGRVEKVSYAEMEPVRGVFAELQVKLTIYRRS